MPTLPTTTSACLERLGETKLRQQVLDGGYWLVEGRDAAGPDAPVVQLAVSSAVVPEAHEAARYLRSEGVAANVLNLTSPRCLYERWRAQPEEPAPLAWLIPPEEHGAPIITVHGASSHALARLGGVFGVPVTALGVDCFGQSGTRAELYHYCGIDAESIAEAAFAAVDRLDGER